MVFERADLTDERTTNACAIPDRVYFICAQGEGEGVVYTIEEDVFVEVA